MPMSYNADMITHMLTVAGSMVCLDKDGNQTARNNLISLISDSEHRQTLVQDLIMKNNQLK